MTTTQTPATLLALHDADPLALQILACEMAGYLARFTESLDAVAELEAGLTDEEHRTFRVFLDSVLCVELRKRSEPAIDAFDRAYVSAPAHLRLIAWVLTKQTI